MDLGAEPDRGQESGGKEVGAALLFYHQVIDFASAPVINCGSPPHSLHYTVVLGSGSEYVMYVAKVAL